MESLIENQNKFAGAVTEYLHSYNCQSVTQFKELFRNNIDSRAHGY